MHMPYCIVAQLLWHGLDDARRPGVVSVGWPHETSIAQSNSPQHRRTPGSNIFPIEFASLLIERRAAAAAPPTGKGTRSRRNHCSTSHSPTIEHPPQNLSQTPPSRRTDTATG